MCYDIKVSHEAQLKRAIRRGDWAAVEEIEEMLMPYTDLPLHHASGFTHPEILIYTDQQPEYPIVATWGLVPHWVHDEEQKKNLWNNTINAKGETIFKKPSFRESAKSKRCLIYVDGFYEHHHFNGKTYPFYIHRKDNEPFVMAGLWSEWKNDDGGTLTTFSIVTTKANPLLAKIHNNPKLAEPRMPFILQDGMEDEWLKPINDNEEDKSFIKDLIQSHSDEIMEAYTVDKLRGKNYKGNVEEISEPLVYEELKF